MRLEECFFFLSVTRYNFMNVRSVCIRVCILHLVTRSSPLASQLVQYNMYSFIFVYLVSIQKDTGTQISNMHPVLVITIDQL